jgi:hypothetical protein
MFGASPTKPNEQNCALPWLKLKKTLDTFYPNKKGMNRLKTILRYCPFNASLRWLWIGLLLVLHYEWLALYL